MTGSEASLPQTDSDSTTVGKAGSRDSTARKVGSDEEPHGDPVTRQSRETVTVTGPGVHRKGRHCPRRPGPVSPSREPRSPLAVLNLARWEQHPQRLLIAARALAGKAPPTPHGGRCESIRLRTSGAAENCRAASASPASSAPWRLGCGVPPCPGQNPRDAPRRGTEGCAEEAPRSAAPRLSQGRDPPPSAAGAPPRRTGDAEAPATPRRAGSRLAGGDAPPLPPRAPRVPGPRPPARGAEPAVRARAAGRPAGSATVPGGIQQRP